MKKIILLLSIFSLIKLQSQNDIRAEILLNNVSEKIDKSESFKISFTYTLENLIENINYIQTLLIDIGIFIFSVFIFFNSSIDLNSND